MGAAASRGLSLGVFLLTFGIYVATAGFTPASSTTDVHASAVQAWAIGTTGTLGIQETADPTAVLRNATEQNPFIGEAGGNVVALRAVGTWLHAVPTYAVLGDPGAFSLVPGGVAAALLAALAVLWMFLALHRLVGRTYALVGAAVFAFATPTWSVSANALWGHTVTQAAITAALLAAAKKQWWLVGLALGAGITARAHLALIPLVVGLGMSWSTRSWRPAVRVGLASAAGIVALVGLNGLVFGEFTVQGAYASPSDQLTRTISGEGAESANPLVAYGANLAGLLVSPGRGVLIFTPLLLLLLPAVMRAWASAPAWTKWFALGGLAYTAAQLFVNPFHGGDNFATYRLGLELVTSVTPLYTFAARQASARVQVLAAGVAVGQVGVIALGALLPVTILAEEVWTDTDLFFIARGAPLLTTIYLAIVTLAALLVARAAFTALHTRQERTTRIANENVAPRSSPEQSP